jgi:hypothetical protein
MSYTCQPEQRWAPRFRVGAFYGNLPKTHINLNRSMIALAVDLWTARKIARGEPTTDLSEPSVSFDIVLPLNTLKRLVQKIPDVKVTFKGIQQRPVKAFGEQ